MPIEIGGPTVVQRRDVDDAHAVVASQGHVGTPAVGRDGGIGGAHAHRHPAPISVSVAASSTGRPRRWFGMKTRFLTCASARPGATSASASASALTGANAGRQRSIVALISSVARP